VKHVRHSYRTAEYGRSITTRPGIGGLTMTAHLKCPCGKLGSLGIRTVFPPEQIDQKFRQAGWLLDPHRCPDCLRASRAEEKTKMTKPSAAAMKAQTQMFRLLSDHFDVAAGAYSPPWSDAKIATDTGLSKDVVAEYRRAGFGEIKEPTELAAIRADINSLESLQREHAASVTADIASLRTRLSTLSARFGA
jgi:hypothetical protein